MLLRPRIHGIRLGGIAVLATGSMLALAGLAAGKPQAAPAASATSEARKAAIARGQYLATTMGCNDCHTPGTFYGSPDFSRRLSGSELGWKGPWGVSFARNLTPDMETGLGYWSEAEIVNALRTGVRPDGKTLLPPMPWPNMSVLTDADAKAIAAYLMSLPPVKHEVPDAVPPGQPYAGPVCEFPPPPAWDDPAKNTH